MTNLPLPMPIVFNHTFGIHNRYYTQQELMKLCCHVLQKKAISDDELFEIIEAAARRRHDAERYLDSQNTAESLEYCI